MRRFGVASDTQVILRRHGALSATLPLDTAISCGDLMAHYVELNTPATCGQVVRLAEVTPCPPQKPAGQEVDPALLFFGIGSSDVDYLYREKIEAWQTAGVVSLRLTCSEASEIRYVQHRVWSDRDEVTDLFRQGAIVYVCGDGRHMAPAVRETLIDIYRDATGSDVASAHAWADDIEHIQGHQASDVSA